ncbi:SDR family oxidoreductase [Roseomonas sp. BN140053]|uniref:SDR family oxidoreductase n=1 Tax=Roseomonas sp. BN140053 TaxID=3391898 RepID=UPI0039ECC8B7
MSGHVLVTGGGRGIGAAICRAAAGAGYAVTVNYRERAQAAESLAAEIRAGGGRAVAIAADVSREAEVERLFVEAEAALGPLSGLVNNAGITGASGQLAEADPAMMRAVLELNVVGTLLCAQAAVRRMARGHGGAGGVIVNISSNAALSGSGDMWVWYAASKGAVDTLTLGLGREVAREGIRVVAVAPGFVATELLAEGLGAEKLAAISASIPMGRPATPEEIAGAVAFALSDAASYMTATVMRVTGGR